jgi:hypothetical protein
LTAALCWNIIKGKDEYLWLSAVTVALFTGLDKIRLFFSPFGFTVGGCAFGRWQWPPALLLQYHLSGSVL